MHDLKALRADPAAFDAALVRRGIPNGILDGIIAIDSKWREQNQQVENELARRRKSAETIAQYKREGRDATLLMGMSKKLNEELESLERLSASSKLSLEAALAALPNLPAPDVPDGADEHSNVEQKRWGTPRNGGLEHDALAATLGWNPEAAARIAGARFAVMSGPLARLHRALGQYMLDAQVAAGYSETLVPLLVRDEAMFGTGQLPKFAEDSFQTTDGRWLIPTAEVSLTNLVREQILDSETLPLRLTALTPCFRQEAGAAGRDTRGLIRQHQFEKVELVTICTSDAAATEHERMTRAAEAILESLDLPYRRMLLCAGDMGFSARKTYDLEVWLPGAGTYREISSVSDCGDFQARRMDARFRVKGEKGTQFVHTLNGSGLAVGRTLVAVLENHQNPDGSVTIPSPIRAYMGGLEMLEP